MENTLPGLLDAAAQAHPSKPLVVNPGVTVTYGQMAETARRIGKALVKETAQPVVALYFPMMPEFIAAFFGVQYSGKQALPLNLLLPPADLLWILKDAGADLIVAPAELAPKLAPLGFRVKAYQELVQTDSDAQLPRIKPEDVSTLLYTSGTSGTPKGVMLTQQNLASNCQDGVATMRMSETQHILACLPTFHTFALTATILAPIAAGGQVTTLPRFDPEGVLAAASAQQCNTLVMVPLMYRLVTRVQQRHPFDMKQLRLAIGGGEAPPSEVRESFEKTFGVPLLEGYGQTEASPVICFNTPWAHQPGTAGKPIPHVSIKIVDPDTLQELPPRETGEIWVHGPNVMKGYHHRPEETAKVLQPGGWLRTGDMGHLTPDGFLCITGRLREMIKVAGEMVFPAEVENALLTHPAVLEAGVTGAKDERKGESVKAFVVLKPGEQATEDALVLHCRAALAPYKVPRTVEFRAELPKGPTGKVQRRLLK